MKISVKVVPGSNRDSISGWLDNTLKIRVRAKPEQGKANRAVEKLLARIPGLQHNAVRIVAGFTSPRKLVRIEGLSGNEIEEKINNSIQGNG